MTRQSRLKSQAESYAVSSGPSIREMIQEDLDDAMDTLMEIRKKDGIYPDLTEARGYAYGLARALAIMTNPYDFEAALVAIRADAVERWQERDCGDLAESVAGSREV